VAHAAKSIGIRETLTSLLPRSRLEEIARASGMMRRRRKVDPIAMLWTLTLGFGAGNDRTLAGLRRVYQRVTGVSLVPSAFYDRFTPALVSFLRQVVGELCGALSAHNPRYQGLLSGFEDVVVADASVCKLHRLLSRRFPGTRTNSSPAAAKLHLVMSVLGKGLERVKLTDERTKDHRALRLGPWVSGRLMLFDMGYFRYQLFDCIERNGGYFLTRLPLSANPKIVGINRMWRGRSIDLIGQRLDAVADRLKRATLDVEVEVTFKRRAYAGRRRTDRARFRLIGVRDAHSGSYWFYLTNLPADELEPESVAQLYACRWQVELIFKELKTHYRLDELPTRKAPIVEALVLSSIITLMLSRKLLDTVRLRLKKLAHRIPESRWAALFADTALNILDLIVLPARTARLLAKRVESMLLHEAVDPNASRLQLLQRVDQGVAWAC
jgi:putative transposase